MRTLLRLLRAGMHGVLLFVLPWVTGAVVALVVDANEVVETSGRFVTFFAVVVLPLAVIQLAAVTIKIGRELRSRRKDGQRGFSALVDALDRHVRVLTGRGIGMVIASLAMVALALSAKWGQFGVLAVAGLGIIYLASTAATIISAFSVRAFDHRQKRARGSIEREMSPTVVDAGDPVEERFALARVPVPPGYRLHIEEALPERLGGDTRFALDRSVSREDVTVSAPLTRTPRGVYRLGPADIWFEDVLGLTRVFVASRATAQLRALPRVLPIVFDKRPRVLNQADGPLSALARFATEEHFRTRAYVPGDDLRRVHWKQSVNTGQLVVRVPESVPFSPTRVRLVLDTFLPPSMRVAANAGGRRVREGEPARARPPEVLDDVLDLLVEGWLSLAYALQRRGESVTLVVGVPDGGAVVAREMPCKRGEDRKWRSLGSDCAWQHEMSLERIAEAGAPARGEKPPSVVVVTAGLGMSPALSVESRTVILADAAGVVVDPAKDERSALGRALFLDYPVGSEDNRTDFAKWFAPKLPSPERVRAELGLGTTASVARAREGGAAVLLLRRRGAQLALESP